MAGISHTNIKFASKQSLFMRICSICSQSGAISRGVYTVCQYSGEKHLKNLKNRFSTDSYLFHLSKYYDSVQQILNL